MRSYSHDVNCGFVDRALFNWSKKMTVALSTLFIVCFVGLSVVT